MTRLVEDLFRQNEWANLRLIAACRALTDAQLDAATVGAFGTIRQTLTHLVGGEATYVHRLGGTPARRFARDEPWPGFGALEAVVRDAATGLIERAGASLAPIAFEGESTDPEVILVQALNHGTEHRGQVCTILTSLGVEPPALDGWTWGEATGRIRPASSG